MASSKLMVSSTSRNSDHRRRSSSSSSVSEIQFNISKNNNGHNYYQRTANNSDDISNNSDSMTIDGLLRNVCGGGQTPESTLLDAEITLLDAAGAVAAISEEEGSGGKLSIRRQESVSRNAGKTVDDVWREIVAGRRVCKQEVPDNEMMTLEDFLAKAGAVDEEDVKVAPVGLPTEGLSGGLFAFDRPIPSPSPFLATAQSVDSVLGFGNGVEVSVGRGKKRAIFEPMGKAAQRRQRRMIKNRESAARSRERKQAYQVELESLAVKLEEEHEQLLKERKEQTKKRFKQLMETVIPVVEKRKPARSCLRRVCSMDW